MRNILLVEPSYKTKYPPLGLMKISAYHKSKGDNVEFTKGLDPEKRFRWWDRIYISTIFTFYWSQTIKTIKYYRNSVDDNEDIKVGGVMASLMKDEIEKETGIRPVSGLLNENGKLGYDDDGIIDNLVPDYSILDEISYRYPTNDAYIGYMTRGCVNRCPFCSVYKIEPNFVDYIPIRVQIETIKQEYGEKRDLLLLDNNVLASSEFDKIINEIKDLGFHKDATFNGKLRIVDFNQGLDARLLTRKKMERLAELPIKPLRIAFDRISLKDVYIEKMRWAGELGFKRLSNYILYNYEDDTPEDFYERLRINVELNEKYGTQISSFPMKFIPVTGKNRTYIGPNWNRRYLRGIQCILNATHGVVGLRKKFFLKAFGKDVDEFKKLILMPDDYILYRFKYEGAIAKSEFNDDELIKQLLKNNVIKNSKFDQRYVYFNTKIKNIEQLTEYLANIESRKKDKMIAIWNQAHKNNGAGRWKKAFSSLTQKEKEKFYSIINNNIVSDTLSSDDPQINSLLQHYNKS